MSVIAPCQFSYGEARKAFLSRIGSAERRSVIHPLPGPDGEIAMDVAVWPNHQSDRTIVISSGTHGIEGFCGSFVQCVLLDDKVAEQVLENASLVMIHGVNPFGFAWKRRVNENNIDLNRNFIDHSLPHPTNSGYREISALLEPDVWGSDTPARIRAGLSEAARRHSTDRRWLQAAMIGGQFEFPHGQFYGGIEASWSNLQIGEVARDLLAGRQVVWIDVHTALGDHGNAQCIVDMDKHSDLLKQATHLWGERLGNIRSQSSVAVEISGHVLAGVERVLAHPMLGTYLEYGTVPPGEVGEVLIQDQWLHRYGNLDSDFGQRTKARMMDTFYPDEQSWRESIADIAGEVIAAAISSE